EWLESWGIGGILVHRNSSRNFICQSRTRHCFRSVNRRTGRMQLAAERIVIGVFAMIGLRVRVRSGATILKIRFRQRMFVWRQRVPGRSAGAEENKGDERRENG